MLESLLQSVSSGTILVTGEMSKFFIFAKNSAVCTLREGALLLYNFRKISILLELETHRLQVATLLNSNSY